NHPVMPAQAAARSQVVMLAQARPGDPLIRVEAPADARQVVALLPGGEVKRLAPAPESECWEAHFDIPAYAAEGEYRVTVIVVLADGRRQVLALRYRVDRTPPTGAGRVLARSAAQHEGRTVRLEIEADLDTARVAALLPWGERAELKPASSPTNCFA